MTSFALRRAEESDLAAIIAMLADDYLGAKRETISDPPASAYREAFRAIAADPNQLLLVADNSSALLATLQLTFIPGISRHGAWRGLIEAVRVAAPLRGSGIGAAMIREAIVICRERGCSTVQLTTDKSRTDAHRFYERLGFTQSHFGYKMSL